MKALKEVWKRAENSLCADCGKPGESPKDAGRRVGGRELGLIASSHLVLAVWTAQEPGGGEKGEASLWVFISSPWRWVGKGRRRRCCRSTGGKKDRGVGMPD